MAKKKAETCLLYNGIPLVKRGNVIVYGDMNDKYHLRMTILKTKMVKDLEIATHIYLELVSDSNKTVKKAEREDLYEALDVGGFWLEEALNGNL